MYVCVWLEDKTLSNRRISSRCPQADIWFSCCIIIFSVWSCLLPPLCCNLGQRSVWFVSCFSIPLMLIEFYHWSWMGVEQTDFILLLPQCEASKASEFCTWCYLIKSILSSNGHLNSASGCFVRLLCLFGRSCRTSVSPQLAASRFIWKFICKSVHYISFFLTILCNGSD